MNPYVDALRTMADAVPSTATIFGVAQKRTMVGAADEIERLTPLVVMEFNEDDVPSFTQGFSNHELLSAVTAERCAWFVAEIERLKNAARTFEELDERITELTTERDALAAQVASLKEALKEIAAGKMYATGACVIATKALAIDTTAAEQLLRERDAKVLEEAADHLDSTDMVANSYACWLHLRAEKRRNGK
jgi:chorismate mutase